VAILCTTAVNSGSLEREDSCRVC